MTDLILANAQIVQETRVIPGALHVTGGQITAITEGPGVPAGAVDCGGDFVVPGLIELHTDNLERHIEPRPGVNWPHAAALMAHDGELASVGITTVYDALRVGSIHSNGKANYRKYARGLASEILAARAAGALRISHFLHLRAEICSETLVEELAEFTAEDRVGLVSLMDHTPGQRQFRDLSKLKQYIAKKRNLNDDEFDAHVQGLKDLQKVYGALHETTAVAEAARLGAVLASHDDTTPDQVATSRGHDVKVAEFPTTLTAAQACKAAGIAVIMGAPNLVRGGSHSGNVAAHELAAADCLDILSSDYVPGALLLGACMLADQWNDLPRGIATVTVNTARAVGLADRGVLAEGKRADIVRFSRLPDGTPLVRGVWSRGLQVG